MRDDGRPRAYLHPRKAVTTVGCSVLSHHPSSPNLPLPDFHLFGLLKDSLRGRCFAEKDELKRRAQSALTLQRRVLRNWHAVVQKWKKCVRIITDTLRKNNLNFVKGVPTVCAYCNHNYSFWDKNSRHCFCTAPGTFMKCASPNPNAVSKVMSRNVPHVGRSHGKAEDALSDLVCACC